MSMTLEMVAARVAELEKQMSEVMSKMDMTKAKKKSKKDKSEEPKKKRGVSGYLVFAKEMRESAKEALVEDGNETPKPTEVLTRVAKLWRDLDDEAKEEWNTKAKEINSGSEDEESEAKSEPETDNSETDKPKTDKSETDKPKTDKPKKEKKSKKDKNSE